MLFLPFTLEMDGRKAPTPAVAEHLGRARKRSFVQAAASGSFRAIPAICLVRSRHQYLGDLCLKRMCRAVRIGENDDRYAVVDIGLHHRIEAGDRAVMADNSAAIL